MNTELMTMISCSGYLAAALFLLINSKHENTNNLWAWLLGSIALIAHGVVLYKTIGVTVIGTLTITTMASAVAFLVGLFVSIAAIQQPVKNLLIFIFPLSALCVALSLYVPGQFIIHADKTPGQIAHILFSIMAYSLLAIAAVQALFTAWLDKMIKKNPLSAWIKALPPLEVMEQILFQFIWLGLICLTLSLATGFVYVDNLFAQHLTHKVFFSLFAWIIFSAMLWARYKIGLRGKKAIQWTIGGFIMLLLAYFGTKIILEWVLH